MKSTLKNSKTDWDSYYQKPSVFAQFTRKSTERLLLSHLMSENRTFPIETICELGGANSCFFPAIRKVFPDVMYKVVDNNEQNIKHFGQTRPEDLNLQAYLADLLSENNLPSANDVVFSVGLIEHFSPSDTSKIIQKHFSCSKPDGLVIITFPTPTWLYKTVRFVSEQCHAWIFHDETPLYVADVLAEVAQYGHIVTSYINWGTILTQGVIVAKTKS